MDPEVWKGWRFIDWCNLDKEDDRKIYYRLKNSTGESEEIQFSSDDTVDFQTMNDIRSAIIEKAELIENEWHVLLKY